MGDVFMAAFAPAPRVEESTLPWCAEQHYIGDVANADAPTQMENTQQASEADAHAAALDSFNRGMANPFVPPATRGVLEHPEAPPAVKAKSAPPAVRIDDEIWQQAMRWRMR